MSVPFNCSTIAILSSSFNLSYSLAWHVSQWRCRLNFLITLRILLHIKHLATFSNSVKNICFLSCKVKNRRRWSSGNISIKTFIHCVHATDKYLLIAWMIYFPSLLHYGACLEALLTQYPYLRLLTTAGLYHLFLVLSVVYSTFASRALILIKTFPD